MRDPDASFYLHYKQMGAVPCDGCGGLGIFHIHPCPLLLEGFRRAAQGIEAGTATTVQQGVVHESPVAESDAPNPEENQ